MGEFLIAAVAWLVVTYLALRFIPLKYTPVGISVLALVAAYRSVTNQWYDPIENLYQPNPFYGAAAGILVATAVGVWHHYRLGGVERGLSAPTASSQLAPCPQCAELIQPQAKVCRFCQYQLPQVQTQSATSADSHPLQPASIPSGQNMKLSASARSSLSTLEVTLASITAAAFLVLWFMPVGDGVELPLLIGSAVSAGVGAALLIKRKASNATGHRATQWLLASGLSIYAMCAAIVIFSWSAGTPQAVIYIVMLAVALTVMGLLIHLGQSFASTRKAGRGSPSPAAAITAVLVILVTVTAGGIARYSRSDDEPVNDGVHTSNANGDFSALGIAGAMGGVWDHWLIVQPHQFIYKARLRAGLHNNEMGLGCTVPWSSTMTQWEGTMECFRDGDIKQSIVASITYESESDSWTLLLPETANRTQVLLSREPARAVNLDPSPSTALTEGIMYAGQFITSASDLREIATVIGTSFTEGRLTLPDGGMLSIDLGNIWWDRNELAASNQTVVRVGDATIPAHSTYGQVEDALHGEASFTEHDDGMTFSYSVTGATVAVNFIAGAAWDDVPGSIDSAWIRTLPIRRILVEYVAQAAAVENVGAHLGTFSNSPDGDGWILTVRGNVMEFLTPEGKPICSGRLAEHLNGKSDFRDNVMLTCSIPALSGTWAVEWRTGSQTWRLRNGDEADIFQRVR